MPKKFTGENSKAAAARAAKAAVQAAEKERLEKAKEDAYWQDDDKNEEKEKKDAEARAKKLELKALADEEMARLGSAKGSAASASTTASVPKVTRHQLELRKEELDKIQAAEDERRRLAAKKIVVQADDELLASNTNRLTVTDGHAAVTVDEALDVMAAAKATVASVADDLDRHPEKRLKAAYTAFEERMLAELKHEWPTLRMSQLKQMVKKEWLKSPENPINQRVLQMQTVAGKVAEATAADGDSSDE